MSCLCNTLTCCILFIFFYTTFCIMVIFNCYADGLLFLASSSLRCTSISFIGKVVFLTDTVSKLPLYLWLSFQLKQYKILGCEKLICCTLCEFCSYFVEHIQQDRGHLYNMHIVQNKTCTKRKTIVHIWVISFYLCTFGILFTKKLISTS